jgi:macrophage erythroblast attacher
MATFRSTVYSLNALPSAPLLHYGLYAGLASLKLPACYHSNGKKSTGVAEIDSKPSSDFGGKNADCPVCDADMGKLGTEVPFSHHANSTIVCRITGKIMDADNMPLAFPDGYVYSREVRHSEQYLEKFRSLPCPGFGRHGCSK